MFRSASLLASCFVILTIGITASMLAQAREDERSVTIDFKLCTPERKTVSFSHGSTIYELKREGTKGCRLSYGTEIENPEWDQVLDVSCLVPKRLGKQKFPVTSRGVDFSSLQPYCKRRQQ